jgi:hypothetical protein
MHRGARRSSVFIASSSQALPIARELERGLSPVADVTVWDKAFDAGNWLLGGILNRAQECDFGVFVIRDDDVVRIKHTEYVSVRDNVLFEAGVFMGSIGPQRSFILWPDDLSGQKLRLPADLEGLLRVTYSLASNRNKRPNLRTALEILRKRIDSLGPALRSGYNEIAALKQALHEREIEFADDSSEPLGDIVRRAAKRRKTPYYSTTEVSTLTRDVGRDYADSVVDLVYWWLIIYGIITFDNVDQWTDGDFHYLESQHYSMFTDRGVVLLNEYRTAGKRAGKPG